MWAPEPQSAPAQKADPTNPNGMERASATNGFLTGT